MEHVAKLVVLVVGLIGAGKSTVLEVLKEKGVAVIDTDKLFQRVVYQEKNRERLASIFGYDVLLADGTPNKNRLRFFLFPKCIEEKTTCVLFQQRLFTEFDADFYNALEQEVKIEAGKAEVTMIAIESALALVETLYEKVDPDEVISLLCDKKIRLHRAEIRNPAIDTATYEGIMLMQPTDEEHFKQSHAVHAYVIRTEFSKSDVKQSVEYLYKEVFKLK